MKPSAADRFLAMSRDQRLYLVGARLHCLESRCGMVVELDKHERTCVMFWDLIESEPGPALDARWVRFCLSEKMIKYLRKREQDVL